MTNVKNNVSKGKFRASTLERYAQQFRAWRSRRQATNQLNAMPDYLLKDVGITRGQIEEVVNYRGDFASVSRLKPVVRTPVVAEVRIKRAA